jgi:hypothetical protein
MHPDEYAHVPNADRDAEVDPHWLELRGSSALPPTYMPPSMPGTHSRSVRVTAIVVTAVFLTATAAGVCLTYGPKVFGS